MTTVVEAKDAESAMRLLRAARGVVRLRTVGRPVGLRLVSDSLGPVRFDRVTLQMGVDAACEPTDALVFGQVITGAVCFRTDRRERWYREGDIYLACRPEQARTSMARPGEHEQIIMDPALMAGVAGTAPGRGRTAAVRFSGTEPVDRRAAAAWQSTCAYLREVLLTVAGTCDEPLLTGTMGRLLAATALTVFPNDALPGPTPADRNDAHPATLRRAIAFIDDNAHRDITPADIAAACHVTVRAVQLTFQRHLGTTPVAYLRRVRLEHAYRHLRDAAPASTSVGAVARRWGFANHSRFTAAYRAAYGQLPSHTLRGLTGQPGGAASRAERGFAAGTPGKRRHMQPQTPDQPLPVATVNVGMTVVDRDGKEAGRVSAVQMPGTDVRPDVVAGIAEELMGAGYLRIDGTGFLSNDAYAGGDQIRDSVEGEPGVVNLRVGREDLHRAT
jgi:AraC-like DNA-binding protein